MSESGGNTNGRVELMGAGGGVRFIGWLFTVGYAHLKVTQAILAIISWPYTSSAPPCAEAASRAPVHALDWR